ncbi:ABC transporter ATP-binding protein [Bacillus sp. TS-2]|nr:ABC transporter ATP-binding protein [Bacillus sp. TS-2]
MFIYKLGKSLDNFFVGMKAKANGEMNAKILEQMKEPSNEESERLTPSRKKMKLFMNHYRISIKTIKQF